MTISSIWTSATWAAELQPLSTFPDSGTLQTPQGMAVDQASGDIYVVDIAQFGLGATVDKFDSAGNPVTFSAPGSNIRGNELTGTPSSPFSFLFPSGVGVAVDNSGGPFNGDVYITDSLNQVVDVFAASGSYLGQLNGSTTPEGSFGLPCGVGVDGLGRVYVGELINGTIERYTPSIGTLPVSDADYSVSELSGVGGVCALAVSGAGDVFASTWEAGPLDEYSHGQFPASGSSAAVPTEVAATSRAVAVDQTTGHVFVDDGEHISEYDPTEAMPPAIDTFGALSSQSYGLAVRNSTGAGSTVYASDDGAIPDAKVEVWGPAVPTDPAITHESATKVTSSSADLNADLNPDFSDTIYHFDYGTTTMYGDEVPTPGRDLGAEGGLAGLHAVRLHIQGLQPNTTYHYRLAATNGVTTTEGPDATFETRRPSGSLVLPDTRGWEMVSPLNKSNSLIIGIGGIPGGTRGDVAQAAPNGESIVYASNGAFAEPSGSTLASQYLAKRGPTGWSTTNLTLPMLSEAYSAVGHGGPYKAFSEDLSGSLLLNGDFRPVEDPPLTNNAPAGYQNLYLRDVDTGAAQAILTQVPPESPTAFKLELEGATPDLKHIVFSTSAALTPEAIKNGEPNLYEWANGQLSLVNVLPHETQGTPGAVLGEDSSNVPGGLHAISDDGSAVFFTWEGNLYVREDGTHTIQVDESKEGLESGGGTFQTASTDGSRVFFTDAHRLTSDATSSNLGFSNLYELNLDTGQLSDLTTADPAGAEVQRVVGASADGAYVYFVANGILAPGASHGRCELTIIGGGQQPCNLYVWHRDASGTTTHFIATLSEGDNLELATPGDADDWAPSIRSRTSRVTPDGLHVAFMSDHSLTGYDNRDTLTSKPDQEVYDYNAGTGVLSCASCNRNGGRPIGSASIPGGTQYDLQHAIYQSRVLSDAEGQARVFFDSNDALVSADANGRQDVYEWEEAGRGDCQASSGGCVGLISSGTSSSESLFVDASSDGSGVFFLTTTQLVPEDTDKLLDLYDAREGGGLEPSPAVPACLGTGCQGVPSAPPLFATPPSVTFNGVGNFSASTGAAPKPRKLTRSQKLTKTLKACKKKTRKTVRKSCEKLARKHYGPTGAKRKPAKGGK